MTDINTPDRAALDRLQEAAARYVDYVNAGRPHDAESMREPYRFEYTVLSVCGYDFIDGQYKKV